MKKKLKVLIVDDSLIFRSAIKACLSNVEGIEVIGLVQNGIKALNFIKVKRPDLVTLDIEMPEMDGLETLNEIQKINNQDSSLPTIGVIMLSALTNKGADITIKALESGAFDFITKPEEKKVSDNIENLRHQLVIKIRYFASKRASSLIQNKPFAKQVPIIKKTTETNVIPTDIEAIVIGVSTGGPRALMNMIPRLCAKGDIPIFIVQHMPPKFTESLAKGLNTKCEYTVVEGKNNSLVKNKHIYIAPGGKHMLIKKNEGVIFLNTNDHPPEKGCRPSVNILFRSALSVFSGNLLVLILTGMGDDGTSAIRSLKRANAYVIAQDEPSSVVWGMPGSAVKSGYVDDILPLESIPQAAHKILGL